MPADVVGVTLLARLQPRDADLAARVLSTLALVAGGVTVFFAAVAPAQQGATPASISVTSIAALSVVAVALLVDACAIAARGCGRCSRSPPSA